MKTTAVAAIKPKKAASPRIAEARALSLGDYRALASFRYEIRRFLAFSERAARGAGIEPQQHQLLLALHGLPASARPTIGAVAERLCVQHHTTVALVDKLEASGWLIRERGSEDRREVLVRLTPEGLALLRELSALHRDQLRNVGPAMVSALTAILNELASPPAQRSARAPRSRSRSPAKRSSSSV